MRGRVSRAAPVTNSRDRLIALPATATRDEESKRIQLRMLRDSPGARRHGVTRAQEIKPMCCRITRSAIATRRSGSQCFLKETISVTGERRAAAPKG